jgi:hypothetical protein
VGNEFGLVPLARARVSRPHSEKQSPKQPRTFPDTDHPSCPLLLKPRSAGGKLPINAGNGCLCQITQENKSSSRRAAFAGRPAAYLATCYAERSSRARGPLVAVYAFEKAFYGFWLHGDLRIQFRQWVRRLACRKAGRECLGTLWVGGLPPVNLA